MEAGNRERSLIVESAHAHALFFERPLAPTYDNAVGVRILVSFLVVAIGVFFALHFAVGSTDMRGMPGANLLFVAALLVAFVLFHRAYVRTPMADIGLRRWKEWTRGERLYFLQVVPLAGVGFAIVFGSHLRALLAQHGLVGFLLFPVLTGILWGMVQEFLFRGWLQTELTRRFGAIAGLLVANVVFTLGPLHFDHFLDPDGVRWGGLAAVFGIGLLFGFIYRRSGNLWIPAVLHGLWPLNMT